MTHTQAEINKEMYKILLKEVLAPNIHLFKITAPHVAKKAQAGQFIIIMVDEKGERIPLTIADWDYGEGSITIVFNEVGKTTHKLAVLEVGDSIMSLVGPLGVPAHIEKFGTVATVVSGYSVATIVPIVRALKEAGNKIISLIRAPTKEVLFGEERLKSFSDRLMIASGDGAYDFQGFVFKPLRELLEREKIDRVFTGGPTCMMKFCAVTTKPLGVKTIAILNPIMVDGTGMCGCCRVIVDGKTRFACVEGPQFDAHQVNWDMMMGRRCTYSGDTETLLQYQCYRCAQW